MQEIKGGVTAAGGFAASATTCGIKKSGKKDLALVYSEVPATAAAVFTKNRVKAAPVQISKQNIEKGRARAIIINSGNANACTGKQGLQDASEMVKKVADRLDIPEDEVLVASTGIIGHPLDMSIIRSGIEKLFPVSAEGGREAAEAIMTTDTFVKETACLFELEEKEQVKIGGMAKGSGMIHPDMATMLAFITTDIAIKTDLLQQALKEAVEVSFNKISVDGDQSTNDCVFVMANGRCGNQEIVEKDQDYFAFLKKMKQICKKLARQIVADGEGATKFITINVKEAADRQQAEKVARSIANSSLVKTACFGNDANWGRILAAAGSCGEEIDPDRITVKINQQELFKAGLPVAVQESKLEDLMVDREINIEVILNLGNDSVTFWTTDLSYKYVEINAEYHT